VIDADDMLQCHAFVSPAGIDILVVRV
jgi:hypothetical protein